MFGVARSAIGGRSEALNLEGSQPKLFRGILIGLGGEGSQHMKTDPKRYVSAKP